MDNSENKEQANVQEETVESTVETAATAPAAPVQEETVAPAVAVAPVQSVAPVTIVQGANIPEEYRPISMWGYLGYQILFAIPCVGFILILVFSFGGSRNINLRNFARAYLLAFVIGLIIVGILFAIFGVALFSMTDTKEFIPTSYYN